jgi:hypothetical protein
MNEVKSYEELQDLARYGEAVYEAASKMLNYTYDCNTKQEMRDCRRLHEWFFNHQVDISRTVYVISRRLKDE